jgi:polyhydroxyalkanoate synthesis regulator phasin
MALFDDLSDGVKKAFLAGVGAVAIGAEKSQELVDELIRKGEVTVEQGKSLNEELTRKVKEAVKETTDGASDEMLRAKLRNMTAEKRAEWIARASKIAEDLEVEDVEVADAEYETVVEEPEATAEDAAEVEDVADEA